MLKLKLRVLTLKIPALSFSSEQFDEQPFKVARGIFMDLWRLANDESCLRHQAFWHNWQGPLLEGQQSNNITLIDVLEGVHVCGRVDDFEIPEPCHQEVPLKLATAA